MTVASTPHLRRPGFVVTIASLLAIGYATLLPEPGHPSDARFCLMCGAFAGVDAVLNVLLFVPLGVGLALSGVRFKWVVLMVIVGSISIEAAQFFLISGRDATITDVLTNTLGGAIGFAVTRHVWILLLPSTRAATSLIACWSAIWLVIQVVSGYGFSPSIPETPYYGQLARSLGKNFVIFPGRVLAASLDGIVIPNAALADSRGFRLRLLGGEIIAATVLPREQTPGIAPIVRIADGGQRQIALLAQNRSDLLFAIRSGAADLGLRSPTFGLPRVFVNAPVNTATLADTLRLSAHYSTGDVRMTAQTNSAGTARRVAVTASLGWTLVLPFQWVIEGTPVESIISCTWLVALMIPLGYWTFHVARSDGVRGVRFRAFPALILALSLATAAVGLTLPHLFGLSSQPVRDWLGGLAGLLLGSGLAAWVTLKQARSSKNLTLTWSGNRVAGPPQSESGDSLAHDVGRPGHTP